MGNGYPGRWYEPPKREEPPKPEDKPTEDHLITDYQGLRLDIAQLEELLGSDDHSLSEKEFKRLDKAVVLMKSGAKVLKKVLKARGYRQLKPSALADKTLQREG